MLVLLAFQAEAAPSYCTLKGGRVTAEWISGERAKADEAKHAAAEMRPPNPTPANGLLVFGISRVTIDAADASNYLVVLESGGVELLRLDPEPRVASPALGTMWANTIVVPVPDTWTAAAPLEVHVADKLFPKRCDWRVTAGELVRL